ncbi:unnamed protein product [Choristocarpus tenellus]
MVDAAAKSITMQEVEDARREVEAMVDHNDRRTARQKEQYQAMAALVGRCCIEGCGKKGGGLDVLRWPLVGGEGFSGLVRAAYATLGKLSCNAFSITADADGGEVGLGLYLQASTVNHSCAPSAVQSFLGKTLFVHCVQPIYEGEEVTLGTTELGRPRAIRQDALRTDYFFECCCQRCCFSGRRAGVPRAEDQGRVECSGIGRRSVDSVSSWTSAMQKWPGAEVGDEVKGVDEGEIGHEDSFLEGFRCPVDGCDGLCIECSGGGHGHSVVGTDGRIHESSKGCNTGFNLRGDGEEVNGLSCIVCKARRSAEEARREGFAVEDLLEKGKALAARSGAVGGSEGFKQSVVEARTCLEEGLVRALAVLYRGNWVLSELYSELVSVCLELEDLEAALQHAREGIAVHRACYRTLLPYFPPMANHLSIAGKLILCVQGSPAAAYPLLVEAIMILEVTHGEKHRLCREVRELAEQARHGG